jgi:hypothetical protein
MRVRSFAVPSLSFSLLLLLIACSSATTAPSNGPTGTLDGSVQASSDSGAQGQGPSSPGSDASAQGSDAGTSLASDGGDAAAADLDMQASDFECILRWAKVGDYRITNKLGDVSGALAIANASNGGVFPVGTIVQLIPDEAMVKRHAGFNAASDDWEFFNLSTSASGTVINQRGGGASVTNFTGSSCLNCHGGAAPQWDMICGTTHGCNPLPINEGTIQTIQNGDPRCVDGG